MALKYKSSPINSLFKEIASALNDRIFSKSRRFFDNSCHLYCKLLYQEFHANAFICRGEFLSTLFENEISKTGSHIWSLSTKRESYNPPKRFSFVQFYAENAISLRVRSKGRISLFSIDVINVY